MTGLGLLRETAKGLAILIWELVPAASRDARDIAVVPFDTLQVVLVP